MRLNQPKTQPLVEIGRCQTERKHREYGRIWSDYGACLQAEVVVYSGANTALSLASKGCGRFASSS